MSLPDWLPPLVRLDDYGGYWDRYEEALYQHFQDDFLESRPEAITKPVSIRHHPKYKGKEWAFWHLISSGRIEQERLPDFRRCERIRRQSQGMGEGAEARPPTTHRTSRFQLSGGPGKQEGSPRAHHRVLY